MSSRKDSKTQRTTPFNSPFTKGEKYMLRCIELAKKGAGYVSPNPMVGCVIVKNGKIIGEGFHQKYGEAHAEINALEKAGEAAKGADMYVSLEPCFHYGKTPPCVDAVIKSGVSKVIIGVRDPHTLVNGRSIRKLVANGITVVEGVLEDNCRELNKFFFKYVKTGLPYVTLKVAMTLDGRIAAYPPNPPAEAESTLRSDRRRGNLKSWISSFESRKLVHKMRSEHDAVLVGRRTVELDNPSLSVRHVKGRNPVRVVIDMNLRMSPNYKIFDGQAKTIVLTGVRHKGAKTLRCKMKKQPHSIDLKDAMRKLGKMGTASVLVEGGAATFSEFLRQGIADELVIFVAPKIFGKGLSWVEKDVTLNGWGVEDVESVGSDVLLRLKIKNQK